MSLPNRYHLRRVAESAARACYICYKPSPSVLITPDNKDYFYVCAAHLKDRGFCSPVIDEEEVAEKKRREEFEREIEMVKLEYEEKMKKKKGKWKKKEDKEKKDDEDDAKDEDDEGKKAEKEKDDKIRSIQAAAGKATTADVKVEDDMPRVYTLHKTFYQMRVDRLRQMEMAKRNRERLRDSSLFPSTPKSDI